MSKWLDKYILFKQEVISRISELVKSSGKESIDLSGFNLIIYMQDSYSSEYVDYNVVSVNSYKFILKNRNDDDDAPEVDGDFSDIDVNELVSICDILEEHIEELNELVSTCDALEQNIKELKKQ